MSGKASGIAGADCCSDAEVKRSARSLGVSVGRSWVGEVDVESASERLEGRRPGAVPRFPLLSDGASVACLCTL